MSTAGSLPEYYCILEVPTTASLATIRKSYQRLALRYHPDRNPAPEAIEKFKKLQEAYRVLGNADTRQRYDVKHRAQRPAAPSPPPTRGAESPSKSKQQKEPSPEENFSWSAIKQSAHNFFDTHMRNRRNLYPRSGTKIKQESLNKYLQKVPGLATAQKTIKQHNKKIAKITLHLTFYEFINGVTKKVKYKNYELCPACYRQKYRRSQTCPECAGKKQFHFILTGNKKYSRDCARCEGRGRIALRRCGECRGEYYLIKNKIFYIKIPPGTKSGKKYQEKQGAREIILTVEIAPALKYHIAGKDLNTTVAISEDCARRGGKIKIDNPGGKGLIELTIPPGIENHVVVTVPGAGIKSISGPAGNLRCEIIYTEQMN